ncbi:MAG TPA: hypothetical protein VHC90_10505 [Bryobacteraceae bacterium]|nr:hypothetical protein [Bryobacteraceae bacterium]
MEDFGIPPVGWGDRYSGKNAIHPRKRQRQQDQEQQDQQDLNEEPVDTVVLSSEIEEED